MARAGSRRMIIVGRELERDQLPTRIADLGQRIREHRAMREVRRIGDVPRPELVETPQAYWMIGPLQSETSDGSNVIDQLNR
jgi:hypothetical protein